jgi:hypothetical protein
LPRGGKQPNAGRKKKPLLSAEEYCLVGFECEKWRRLLIRWIMRSKLRDYWIHHPAGEHLAALKQKHRELNVIPRSRRLAVVAKRPRKDQRYIGIEGDRTTLDDAKAVRLTFLHKLGRLKSGLDSKELPASPMPPPPTFHWPAFPRGYRPRIIVKAQKFALRRFGKRVSQNEVESAWALVRDALSL